MNVIALSARLSATIGMGISLFFSRAPWLLDSATTRVAVPPTDPVSTGLTSLATS